MTLDTFIKTNYKPLLALSKSQMLKIRQTDIAADMLVELYFFLRDIDDGNNKIKALPTEHTELMALSAMFFKNQVKYYSNNKEDGNRSLIHKYINKSNDTVTFNYPSDEPYIDKPEELEDIKDKLLLNKVLSELPEKLKLVYQYFYIDKLSTRQIADNKEFEGKKYTSVQWWKLKKKLHQHIKIQMNNYGYP